MYSRLASQSVHNPRTFADWMARPLSMSTQGVSLGFWNVTHLFHLAIDANKENHHRAGHSVQRYCAAPAEMANSEVGIDTRAA